MPSFPIPSTVIILVRTYLFVRFMIKEKALTMSDLDDIWAAQAGKHEVSLYNYRGIY